MIRLENFTEDDFQQLIEWVNTDHLMTNWAGSLFSFPLTNESLQWYIQETNDHGKSDALVYKAVDTTMGATVGHISLGSISRKNRSARISRVLVGNTAQRGKGICCKMINSILKIAFEELKLHRVGLGVYDFNKSAIGCYKKTGFSTEGIMRDILLYENEYWSLVEMSILEDEWFTLHPGKQCDPVETK
jgi:RimJ/RimL family protein N-acetyltransferase